MMKTLFLYKDILDKVGKSMYFSRLDCAPGYQEINVDKGDQCITFFSPSDDHFEFKRMPLTLRHLQLHFN